MARQPTEAELDAEVEFFNPYPRGSRQGAEAPIPNEVKLVADALVGRRLTLRQALKDISAACVDGKAEVDPDYRCIMLWWGDLTFTKAPCHLFRVIQYR
jgi:hypothetical protein